MDRIPLHTGSDRLPPLLPPGPEASLLLAAARWPCGTGGDAPPPSRSPIEPAALAAAQRHSLVPALHAYLAEADPDAVTDALREARRRCTLATLRQRAALRRLLGALAEKGVEALVLKGLALSLQLYGAADLRPAVDIDLLVAPERAEQAGRVLEALGFRPASRIDVRRLTRLTKDAIYLGPDGVAVELHWRPLRNRRLLDWRFADLWAERETLRADDAELHTLPRDRNAVFLALHGIHHGWQKLRWLADIALLLRGEGAVEGALDRARRDRALPAMLHTLVLAHRLIGLPLSPDHVAAWRASRRAAAIDATVLAWNERRADRRPGLVPPWLGEHWMERRAHLLLCPDAASVVEELAILFRSPADRDAFPLPDRLDWLYPVLRPAMLLARAARGYRARRDDG